MKFEETVALQAEEESERQWPKVLINLNVLGCAGSISFVVNEEELVAAVIDTALKSYACEGRLLESGLDLTGEGVGLPNKKIVKKSFGLAGSESFVNKWP